jgi:predicted nuclease of predicted toxin-antitoxin system
LKLLVDENLPPAAAIDLADLFPESIHVRSVGLASVADGLIWEFAREHGYVFITKDKDFANLSLARGAPPKVILIQTGNCSVEELLSLMRRNSIRFAEFDDDPHRALLVLR